MTQQILRNRTQVFVVSYTLLIVIGVLDYISGHEISSSILYLIPIYVVAAQPRTSKLSTLLIAGISSAMWLLISIVTGHPHSSYYVLAWNALVRAIIFFSVSWLIYRANLEHQIIIEKNKQLVRLNDEKNKFIGVAAHDIRTPLGSIFNLTNLLLDGRYAGNFTEEQKIEFISMIRRVSANCLELLNNMLDITQIESGTLRLKKGERDYVNFLRAVIAANEPLARQKDQQITLESSVAELLFSFDSTYINQVLTNLLTNAIKYSQAHRLIRVVLRVEGDQVRTEVIDQGLGIRQQDQDKIFRAFERTQNLPTAGESSNGLGLAIVKKVIETHGGSIGFGSEYGKGSTFYFTLPLGKEKLDSQLMSEDLDFNDDATTVHNPDGNKAQQQI
jgi:signal transduction histidine kinase